MAAKRIAQSSINWAALAERVPEHQRTQFLAFKSKSDNYLRRVLANPEKPPAIDWSFYKAKVPVAGMVEEFQKQYTALAIPFPPDTVSSQIDVQEKEIQADIEKFKKESNVRIEGRKFGRISGKGPLRWALDRVTELLPGSDGKVILVNLKTKGGILTKPITKVQKELAHLASLIPYDQMTMEDFRDAYPDDALDPINRPTFWPHDAESQLDYQPKEGVQQSSH